MAVAGWLLDKSAAARIDQPEVADQVDKLAGSLCICPIGMLEQLYSARSAPHYDALVMELSTNLQVVDAPPDILQRALALQRDLAHHRGMWHRTPIPDLLIAEIALHHGLGVVHVDSDYERIARVRPLAARRLRTR